MAEEHTRPETVDYVAKIIKAKPDTAYADIVKTAKKDGFHVYPLIMGMAKNELGMGGQRRQSVDPVVLVGPDGAAGRAVRLALVAAAPVHRPR